MKKLFSLLLVGALSCSMAWGDDVASVTINGTTTNYTTFEDALAAANATTGATVTLLADYQYASNGGTPWNITSSMTIDGQNHKLSGWGKRTSNGSLKSYPTLLVNNGGSSMIDVTLKNLNIQNDNNNVDNNRYVKAIETRGYITSLTLNTVNIVAKNGAAQGICIGSSQESNAVVNIEKSSIDVGDNGYAILTFNPTTMTIDNSKLYGFSTLYLKGMNGSYGSYGSTITIQNQSELISNNTADGGQNYFGTIVCEDGGITVNATNCTIKAIAASKNVTNSIFCNSSANYYSDDNHKSADNVFNIGDGCKVNLSTKMRYFVIDDTYNYMYNGNELHSNAIVNLLSGSMYNFIPVDKYVYNSEAAVIYYDSEGYWDDSSYDYSKPSHIACQSGMGVLANEDASTKSDFPYTIGALTAPNPYAIVAYKGDEEEHDINKVDATSWEAQVATKPNTVGIISAETYEAVTATAFAKSTNNIVVSYPVGDDDYAYVAPTFNVTDLTDSKIGSNYDKTDYYSPEDFTATKGSYSRALKAGCNSACVPFDVKVDNVHFFAHELLTFSTFDQDANTVYFEYVNEVSAGTPFIILLSSARTWKVDFASTPLKGQPNEADAKAGVFRTTDEYGKAQKGEDEAYYSITPSGYFGKLTNNLYPFRACFQLEGATAGQNQSNNAAPRLGVITESNTVTYVDEVLSNSVASEKYIEDGKLVIYHNGKFYNANGMLVK